MAEPTHRNIESLRAVTIGEPTELNGSILLVNHDSNWHAQYLQLAGRIRRALGAGVLQLEHVGSTSVPGLAAKPIIDMLLVVRDSAAELEYVPALEQRGFVLRIREPRWFEHRMLEAAGAAGNLHVFSQGCEESVRMLAFRDWLRSHPADRQLYEDCKRALAARQWQYVQDYAQEKSAVVADILARALAAT